MNSNAPDSMIARLKWPSKPPNAAIAKKKTPDAIAAYRKNTLDSLFKVVRVFEVFRALSFQLGDGKST